VGPALDQIDQGVRAASAAAVDAEHRIRLTLLPSFAQRWLLPRMARWRERHPDIAIELHSSQQVVDLQREGFHAALRQGGGRWPGLQAERLFDSPWIAVGSPAAAQRIGAGGPEAMRQQPLLGSDSKWERWFDLSGLRTKVKAVAAFNDAGLMLQAVEQDLGIALAREVLAADALHDGRLVRLSDVKLPDTESYEYWLAYPPALAQWPPIAALREWLLEELAASSAQLNAAARKGKARARR
jgi:LysR family glycine cleavage system transcriptional activator